MNPLAYEEGRETLGVVIIIAWMKTTSYVSKTQFRFCSYLHILFNFMFTIFDLQY